MRSVFIFNNFPFRCESIMRRYLVLVLFWYDLIASDVEVICGCKCQPNSNELADDIRNFTCSTLNREMLCCEGSVETGVETTNLTEITDNEQLTTTDSAEVTETPDDNLVIVYPHQMSGIPKIKTNFNQTERISVRSLNQNESVLIVYPQPITDFPETVVETTEIPGTTEQIGLFDTSEPTTDTLESTEQTTVEQFEDEFESVTIAYSAKVFHSVPTDLPSVASFPVPSSVTSSRIAIQPDRNINQTHIKLIRTITEPKQELSTSLPIGTGTQPPQIEPNATRPIDTTNTVKPTISFENIKIKRKNQFREFLKQKSINTKASGEIVRNKPSSPTLVNIRKNLLETMNRRVPFLRQMRKEGNKTKEIPGTTEKPKELTEISSTRKFIIQKRQQQHNKTRIVRFKPINE